LAPVVEARAANVAALQPAAARGRYLAGAGEGGDVARGAAVRGGEVQRPATGEGEERIAAAEVIEGIGGEARLPGGVVPVQARAQPREEAQLRRVVDPPS